MISKKRLVLISVLTILLVIGGLYATYAINIFEEEVTPTEYDMAFNFDLSGSVTREMTVEAGKTKVFDLDITNPYSDTIQYGVAYSLVSPTTLPSGVTIAESSLSKNSAVGMIDANETISVSIVVVNESSSNVIASFSVINGYKNGGDLIVPNSKVLVEEIYQVGPPSYRKIDNSGANAPGYIETLIPVMYDESTSAWVKADTTSSISQYGWYDYDAKKWANAVLVTNTNRGTYKSATAGTPITESDILAYNVWIPRYKYKVWNINKEVGTDTYNAYTKGIDIEFINNGEDGTITCNYSYGVPSANKGEPNEICRDDEGSGYYTHPAFTFGNDKLSGFWMGKFELSSTDQTAANYGGGERIDLTPRILPDVMSWRLNTVDNFWKVIYDMQINNNIYGLPTDRKVTDSHILTNMEWGAVAYLSHSKYGRCTGGENSTCTEVAINNSGDKTNYYYTTYTGRSSGGGSSSGYSPAGTYTYKETNGQLASTTGNIYGVYDMSGGAHEYVMGNIGTSVGQTTGTYDYYASDAGNNYTYSGFEKYLTPYAYGETYEDQTAYNRGRLGDATSEVLNSTGVWDSVYSYFPSESSSWFVRGGAFDDGENAGVFLFLSIGGVSDVYFTSRAALASIVQ